MINLTDDVLAYVVDEAVGLRLFFADEQVARGQSGLGVAPRPDRAVLAAGLTYETAADLDDGGFDHAYQAQLKAALS